MNNALRGVFFVKKNICRTFGNLSYLLSHKGTIISTSSPIDDGDPFEATFALSCKCQSFVTKTKIMQAYFIFCAKNLHNSKICCIFARFLVCACVRNA